MKHSAEQFLQAAEVQRDYAIQLLSVSQMQRELIENGRYSELIELLQHKQCILDRLHDRDAPNRQCLKDWPSMRSRFASGERNSIEQTLSESERLFGDLAQHESECQQLLQTQRDETGAQLKRLSQNQNVRAAYQSVVAPEPQSRINLVQ